MRIYKPHDIEVQGHVDSNALIQQQEKAHNKKKRQALQVYMMFGRTRQGEVKVQRKKSGKVTAMSIPQTFASRFNCVDIVDDHKQLEGKHAPEDPQNSQNSQNSENVLEANKFPTISESNIYYVYATLQREQYAPVATSETLKDISKIKETSAEKVYLHTGTRLRLHYPMVSFNGSTYMLAAHVNKVTGQFQFLHVHVYSRQTDNGQEPNRFIGEFEV